MASIKTRSDDADILAQVIASMRRLSPESRERVLETIATFFGIGGFREAEKQPTQIATPAQLATPSQGLQLAFSPDRAMNPKQFLVEKKPRTDVDRVACLAFYLTIYRDTPHFSTLDISKLNTEAAQRKFSNAAVAVDNATQGGYLVPASRGRKQLSATGEQYVLALPDYDAAKDVRKSMRPQRRSRKKSNGKA